MKSSFLKILYRSGGASRCLKVSALPRITSISQTDLRRYFVGVADHAEAPPRSLSSESQDAQEDYYDDSNFSDNVLIVLILIKLIYQFLERFNTCITIYGLLG